MPKYRSEGPDKDCSGEVQSDPGKLQLELELQSQLDQQKKSQLAAAQAASILPPAQLEVEPANEFRLVPARIEKVELALGGKRLIN